jgi:hypothetical protein
MRWFAIVGVLVIVASCRQSPELEVPMFSDVAGHPVAFPTTALSMTVTRISPPNQPPYDIVTPVPPVSFKEGLAPAAIVGRLKQLSNIEGQGRLRPQDLIPNPMFLAILHRTVAEGAPQISEYQAEAKKVGLGWLYVIDGRTPAPNGVIHQRDILGAFSVRDGTIQTHSYTPNDQYVVFTEDGFFRLHEALGSKLSAALLAANRPR